MGYSGIVPELAALGSPFPNHAKGRAYAGGWDHGEPPSAGLGLIQSMMVNHDVSTISKLL